MVNLELRHVKKVYENHVVAVEDFNLGISGKEFVVFIGPSGCGKSTTLRMIAGLEEISDGELLIDGKCMNKVEAKDRDVTMVFQDYALYPHMSIFENLAFPLKIRKLPKDVIENKVHEAAKLLGLDSYLHRKPKEISGGQRQRVALGRAIVRSPQIFLLDEPLSNLDTKLRTSMRTELIRLYQSLDAIFIYVTHDQIEAMTMATRIVVMKEGIIQQIGTPQEIYDEPDNLFVATFIGTPQMNVATAVLKKEGVLVSKGMSIPIKISGNACNYDGKEVIYGFRAEAVSIEKSGEIECVVDVIERMGAENNIHLKAGNNQFVMKLSSKTNISEKDTLRIHIAEDEIFLFDADTHERIK